MTLYSEIVKDLKSAKGFCKMNKIIPFSIILIWDEKEDKEVKNNSQRKKDKNEPQDVVLSGDTKLKQGETINVEDMLGVNGNHADNIKEVQEGEGK